MTVEQLIAALQRLPKDAKVYKETGDFADDWHEIKSAAHGTVWGLKGVFIE
jgi:hypothetical protein